MPFKVIRTEPARLDGMTRTASNNNEFQAFLENHPEADSWYAISPSGNYVVRTWYSLLGVETFGTVYEGDSIIRRGDSGYYWRILTPAQLAAEYEVIEEEEE